MLNDKKKRAKTFQSHMDGNGMMVMSKMAAKEMESTNLRQEEIKTRGIERLRTRGTRGGGVDTNQQTRIGELAHGQARRRRADEQGRIHGTRCA